MFGFTARCMQHAPLRRDLPEERDSVSGQESDFMDTRLPLPDTLERADTRRPFLSKGEYVYQILKEMIGNGYLERNKTYTIVEIAESLGVSRTPVGEAVKILGAQNYIHLQPGVGFKVRELTLEEARENLTIAGALEEAVLRKIVREGLAPAPQMEQAVGRSRVALENQAPAEYTRASADFHRAFYSLSRQPRVVKILQENVFIHELWYRQGARDHPELVGRLVADHENILRVLQRRDEDQVAGVIADHVSHCETVLARVIEDERRSR